MKQIFYNNDLNNMYLKNKDISISINNINDIYVYINNIDNNVLRYTYVNNIELNKDIYNNKFVIIHYNDNKNIKFDLNIIDKIKIIN